MVLGASKSNFLRSTWIPCLALTVILTPTTEAAHVRKTCIPSCRCKPGENPETEYHVICDRRSLTSFPDFSKLHVPHRDTAAVEITLLGVKEIPPRAFAGLRVRGIYLARNNLERIHPDAFLGMKVTGSITLDLQNNDLFSLPVGLFDFLIKQSFGLTSPTVRLVASRNKYFRLSDSVFKGVEAQIETLDLEGTGLEKVPSRLLKPLTNLKKLRLGDNVISTIGPKDFPMLPNLTLLDLSYNDMEYIDPEAFSNLPNLQSLSVDENKLTSLSFLKGPCYFRNQLQVDAENNPLECDCELFEVIRANTIKVFGVCAKPIKLMGSYLYDPDAAIAKVGDTPRYHLLDYQGRDMCGASNEPVRRKYDCDCQQFWPSFENYDRNKGSCTVKTTTIASSTSTSTTDSLTTPTDSLTKARKSLTTSTDSLTTPTDSLTTTTDSLTTPRKSLTTSTDSLTTPTDDLTTIDTSTETTTDTYSTITTDSYSIHVTTNSLSKTTLMDSGEFPKDNGYTAGSASLNGLSVRTLLICFSLLHAVYSSL